MSIKGVVFEDLLHYMKSFNVHGIFEKIKKDIDKFYPDSKEKNFLLLYVQCPPVELVLERLDQIIIRLEFLDIHYPALNSLKTYKKTLENAFMNKKVDMFCHRLDHIIKILKEMRKKELNKKLNKLTCEECIRLDEAITNFQNNCFLSAVIMSISVVEGRLHYLIKKRNKALYEKHFKKASLGQLISLFSKDNYKDKKFSSLKKILPQEHRPLIELLNNYRISSVHPIRIDIQPKVAESIISFTFSFLLDDKLKIEEKKLLKHGEI